MCFHHFQAQTPRFLHPCSSVSSNSDDSRVYTVPLPSSGHTRHQYDFPRRSAPSKVYVTLASHCFHQSRLLWHENTFSWWLRAENLPHRWRQERERGRIIITLCQVMTRLRFLDERANVGNWTGLLGLSPCCLGIAGNRKLPPILFLIGWNRLQKNSVFSCMATS